MRNYAIICNIRSEFVRFIKPFKVFKFFDGEESKKCRIRTLTGINYRPIEFKGLIPWKKCNIARAR